MITFNASLQRPGFTLDAGFETKAGLTALFGPSGCGKSTVIRLIAGLERKGRGRITVGGRVLMDSAHRLMVPPHKRRLGLVFQDAQLFPHLDVKANLLFGHALTPPAERKVGLDAVLAVLGIEHLLARDVGSLSGGERQRVAIGRAVLTSPHLLMMDEPLAALDSARKEEILPFIERLRDEMGIPILYVSHAVEEVARLASQVVMLREGRVVASGPPAATLGVLHAEHQGDIISFLQGTSATPNPDYGVTRLGHPAGDITLPGLIDAGAGLRVVIHARNVALAREIPPRTSLRTALAGVVEQVEGEGALVLVSLRLTGGEVLRASITRLALDDLGLAHGVPAYALVKTAAIDRGGVQGLRA